MIWPRDHRRGLSRLPRQLFRTVNRQAIGVPVLVNETMIKKNVAELLVDVLVVAGVQRIYGVAGDSLNGITDTLRQREQIPWVGVWHGSARLRYCHSRKAVE
jgi:hypothetical protein